MVFKEIKDDKATRGLTGRKAIKAGRVLPVIRVRRGTKAGKDLTE
jgi:hypothetical protein